MVPVYPLGISSHMSFYLESPCTFLICYFFRIRGVSIVKVGEAEDNNFYLFTASSDGFIKMFSVLIEEDEVVVFIQ